MIRSQSCVPTHSPTIEPADAVAGATTPVADAEADTAAAVAEAGAAELGEADGATVDVGAPEQATVSNAATGIANHRARARPFVIRRA